MRRLYRIFALHLREKRLDVIAVGPVKLEVLIGVTPLQRFLLFDEALEGLDSLDDELERLLG